MPWCQDYCYSLRLPNRILNDVGRPLDCLLDMYVNTSVLKSRIRTVVVALATVAMLIPSVAMPCCGCCTDVAQQAEQGSTGQCCSKNRPCCEQSTPAKTTHDRCCQGKPSCDGPHCRCSVLPSSAIPPTAPLKVSKDLTADVLGLTSALAGTTLDLASASIFVDDAPTPLLSGNVRLHSRLCVWLN